MQTFVIASVWPNDLMARFPLRYSVSSVVKFFK
jgi:hypothetical protein